MTMMRPLDGCWVLGVVLGVGADFHHLRPNTYYQLRGLASELEPAARASHTILVQLAVKVKSLEDKLHCRCYQRRVPLRVELSNRFGEATDLRRLRHILQRRHPIRHFDAQA